MAYQSKEFTVGQAKNDQIETEERWNAKARIENICCKVCGRKIDYDERDLFFSTGRCSNCESTYEKFERD